MEIVYSLEESNVHCAACFNPIKLHKTCVYYDHRYYHGQCVFDNDTVREIVGRLCGNEGCNATRSLTFHAAISIPNDRLSQQVRARNLVIQRYDTVIDIRVQAITVEVIELADRIRYLIPLKTEGDTITINFYEEKMREWDRSRDEAVAETRNHLEDARGTWAHDIVQDAQSLDKEDLHDVAIIEKAVAAEVAAEGSTSSASGASGTDLVGDENLDEDARHSIAARQPFVPSARPAASTSTDRKFIEEVARKERLLEQRTRGDELEVNRSPIIEEPEDSVSIVDPRVLDIDPSPSNRNYDSQVKKALTYIKKKEFIDAKKLQSLRHSVTKQASKYGNEVIPRFSEKSSNILKEILDKIKTLPNIVKNKAPGFDSFKNWLTENTLGRIDVSMIRDKVMDVIRNKIDLSSISGAGKSLMDKGRGLVSSSDVKSIVGTISEKGGALISYGKSGSINDTLTHLFYKIWHVVEPAVKYALKLAQDGMRMINLDSIKGIASGAIKNVSSASGNVVPYVKSIVGGVMNSNILSNINISNLSGILASLTKWIMPALQSVLKLVMNVKSVAPMIGTGVSAITSLV